MNMFSNERAHLNCKLQMVKSFKRYKCSGVLQIQRGFPVDIVRNTYLLTYLHYIDLVEKGSRFWPTRQPVD